MDSADFYFPPLFSMKKQEKKKIYLTWYLFVFFSCTHAAIKSRKVSDGACPTSSLPGSIPALYCAVHYYTVITSKLWLHFWHFLFLLFTHFTLNSNSTKKIFFAELPLRLCVLKLLHLIYSSSEKETKMLKTHKNFELSVTSKK